MFSKSNVCVKKFIEYYIHWQSYKGAWPTLNDPPRGEGRHPAQTGGGSGGGGDGLYLFRVEVIFYYFIYRLYT